MSFPRQNAGDGRSSSNQLEHLNNETTEAAVSAVMFHSKSSSIYLSVCLCVCVCLRGQEFFDLWPILMGEAAPYDGPKTPDGRVRKYLLL